MSNLYFVNLGALHIQHLISQKS